LDGCPDDKVIFPIKAEKDKFNFHTTMMVKRCNLC
jgi:hypothetical protein